MEIKFASDFEQGARALFNKMIEENTSSAKLPEPFVSLSLIITDDEPSGYLLSFKDEKSGKNGYVISENLNTKLK